MKTMYAEIFTNLKDTILLFIKEMILITKSFKAKKR